MNNEYITIADFTRSLKEKFDTDAKLQHVQLRGEISNFKLHSSGHLYFSLKDATSKINAIMFASSARRLTFKPADGTSVLVKGRVSIYEATGNYQIYVEEMIEDGTGNLYKAYEKLKKELEKEGLFNSAYKKPIPKIPARIGIITAPTGAAIRDILSTIKRRFPLCETYLFPALVQGVGAAPDIVKKLKQADEFGLDVIIMGRGGGSIEDLWAFNEGIVARAIFACKTPIISAVGHEVDFTIADFVADLRAPTPTGAAEMAVPNISDVLITINNYNIRANKALNKQVEVMRMALDNIKSNYILNNPVIMYENKKQLVDSYIEKIKTIIFYKVNNYGIKLDNIKSKYILKNPQELYSKKRVNLDNLITKLELLNPMSVLKRGYTLTYQNDKIVKTAKNIKLDDKLSIKLIDGTINVNVIGIEVK